MTGPPSTWSALLCRKALFGSSPCCIASYGGGAGGHHPHPHGSSFVKRCAVRYGKYHTNLKQQMTRLLEPAWGQEWDHQIHEKGWWPDSLESCSAAAFVCWEGAHDMQHDDVHAWAPHC